MLPASRRRESLSLPATQPPAAGLPGSCGVLKLPRRIAQNIHPHGKRAWVSILNGVASSGICLCAQLLKLRQQLSIRRQANKNSTVLTLTSHETAPDHLKFCCERHLLPTLHSVARSSPATTLRRQLNAGRSDPAASSAATIDDRAHGSLRPTSFHRNLPPP